MQQLLAPWRVFQQRFSRKQGRRGGAPSPASLLVARHLAAFLAPLLATPFLHLWFPSMPTMPSLVAPPSAQLRGSSLVTSPGPGPQFPDIAPAEQACLGLLAPALEPRVGRPAHPVRRGEQTGFPPVASMSWAVAGVPELAGMSETIQATLEYNAIRYHGSRGGYYAFLPGELYDEVYFRDLLTAAKTAQYLYGDAFLRSALEEVLARQLTIVPKDAATSPAAYPGPGALYGMLTREGEGQKTTAPSDEETSAVQLAYLYYKAVGGADWLSCSLNGVPILQRLNLAMDRILQGRFDPGTGLVRRAHTTDWGDVRFQSAARPTQADPTFEYWTASIYDQAWAYLALGQLAEMNRALGQEEAARHWEQAAVQLQRNTQRLLWQPARGFFRLHHHITPLLHDFDEDAMVAIGNAVAIYAGLAEPDQIPTIMGALEAARLRSGAGKPGVSLYPPYPEGFFLHPLMREEGVYQNGGVWDWWGGVQITGEFEAGLSELARQHLFAVARDWATHPTNLAEWHVPAGNQMGGSSHYAGGAGTLGEAVVRGLFGLQLAAEGFSVRLRLGARSGHIHITQPASGVSFWMRYRAGKDALSLQYTTNHRSSGNMAVLLPPDTEVEVALLDQQPLPFSTRMTGQDRYLELGAVPSGAHHLQVRLRVRGALPFASSWEGHSIPSVLPAGGQALSTVTVRNAGASPWLKEGPNPIRVGYQWLDLTGRPLPAAAVPEVHSELPHALAPKEQATAPLVLHMPKQPGLYRLKVDLVQEYVLWFSQAALQNHPIELLVRVQ
ncbi:MAG: hypothetical protein HYY02_07810 [Chloroflexi bacterium]|nr:hypothetical protein [Chloroflexota bacterium]